MRLRLTNLPGWHTSIDGKTLPLLSFSGVMMQAHVPPGTHTVELHYWPGAFTAGLVLAAVSVVSLCAVPLVWKARRRR